MLRNVGQPNGSHPSKSRPKGALKRFSQNDDGFTAVEFAIVATPFLAFIFAILEIALVYFGTFTLENAVDRAAREIRTGQAQGATLSEAQFISKICANVATFSDCNSGLEVDVRSFSSFGGIAPPAPFKGNGDLDASKLNKYDLGKGGDVVLVSVYYQWSLIGQIPGIGLQNQSNGSRLVSAIAAFRNEPFED